MFENLQWGMVGWRGGDWLCVALRGTWSVAHTEKPQTLIFSFSCWGVVASSGTTIVLKHQWHIYEPFQLPHSSSTLGSFGQGMLFCTEAPFRRLRSEKGYCQVINSHCGGRQHPSPLPPPNSWCLLVALRGDFLPSLVHYTALGPEQGSVHDSSPPSTPCQRLKGPGSGKLALSTTHFKQLEYVWQKGSKTQDPVPAGSFLEVLPTLFLSVFELVLLSSLLRAKEDKIAFQISMQGGAGSVRWGRGAWVRHSRTLFLVQA